MSKFKTFKKQYKGILFIAHCKMYTERIVKCWLTVRTQGCGYNQDSIFIGVAKCNLESGDIFSFEKGCNIALEKAVYKYEKTIIDFKNFVENKVEHTLETFDDFIDSFKGNNKEIF